MSSDRRSVPDRKKFVGNLVTKYCSKSHNIETMVEVITQQGRGIEHQG